MPSYCCFLDPIGDYTDKNLEDLSPAGQKYGFPLINAPEKIGDYIVKKPISRGFYGATYVVEDGLLQKKVLKVIPKRIYEYFKKDFNQECILHARIASDSQHIVGINSKFEAAIDFPTVATIDCYVAVLDFVKGDTLEQVLKDGNSISSSKIAQIAIDLFRLLHELNNKQTNHNDLHAGNLILKELEDSNKRADEINNYCRVVAIDLGSLSEESKSNKERIGDINRISNYLKILSKRLLEAPDESNDNDYKLAYLLDEQASFMSSKVENQTLVGFTDAIESIKGAYRKTYLPWKEQLELKNFGDSYNAQTLQPWFVPALLVDPDFKWLTKISNKGPLLITGMRGCGKTMLLRAIQFHARAVPISEEENNSQLKERLQNEKFVGLYVSSRRLLDKLGKPDDEPLYEPFSRLFIAYALESIRTIRHFSDIEPTFVESSYYLKIKDVLKNVFKNDVDLSEINSDVSLENFLIDALFSLSKGEDKFVIELSPSNAFHSLAESIKKCSAIWTNHYILFLLDDVSTRYFHQKNIADLLSALIFQSEICAFKITSEAQTIEVILNSPGNIEKARLGRDVESFDLGQNVYEKIREGGLKNGIRFLEKILLKRAKYYANHPKLNPSELLGENTLINVAKTICNVPTQKDLKNKVYYGMSSLAGICVGDVGEVINLYDAIIKNYNNSYPIKAEKQSECFRDLSSIRLFQLNRIKSDINLKDYALSFAEASHELLMNSFKFTPHKLRQYYSIYIKITSGSKEKQDEQFQKIIELIDSGIFVFAGGSINPRLTSSDTNPIKQFVLIYRKLYGVTNFIGLQQADRFELNGDRLIEYLDNPKKGKEILMRGLGNRVKENDDDSKYKVSTLKDEINKETPNLFDSIQEPDIEIPEDITELIKDKLPITNFFDKNDLELIDFDIVILGLGFEDRALETVNDIFNQGIRFKKAICVKYFEEGQTKPILELLDHKGVKYDIIPFESFLLENKISNNNILCCVSGLPKSLIYRIVGNLYQNNRVVFSHTYAKDYYPLDSDITSYLNDCTKSEFSFEFLEEVTSELVKGEKGPYDIVELSDSNSDESKKRVLITFSSAKYERLFKVIDEREYDIIELISPTPDTPRTKLARIASNILAKRFNHIVIKEFDTNNIEELTSYLFEKYYFYYVLNNYNVEIALTGTKRQTVVSSILSTLLKISKCWYVKPSYWDTERFSKGIGETTYFEIVNKTP